MYCKLVRAPRRFYFAWPILLLFLLSNTEALPQDISWPQRLTARKVIVLDPGHGGHGLGAVGPSGMTEKAVALALAKKVKETLSDAYTVHLTRSGDYWLDIEERTAVANHNRADVFISLHAGGSFQHKAGGTAVFFYGPNAGLAPQPEGPLEESGQGLQPWDHVQTIHAHKSKLLASLVHQRLSRKLSPLDRGIQEAPCLVLKGADMPAILIEIAYVSHPAEEKQLTDPAVISVIANAIDQGIKEFLGQTSRCMNGKGVIIEEDIGTGRGAAW